MAYLLDTNTLIQAKNEYYAFHLCPGFWDWLDAQNVGQNVYSIEPVLAEIREGADDLTVWAGKRAAKFFVPMDAASIATVQKVVLCVQQGDFKPEAKSEFLAKADPLLIAYALTHGCTLATHEVHVEGERKKVKIPTICRTLGVSYVRTFQMLKNEGARFVL
ncbi:MAG: DUF4411 family protein [Verrucomicrobiota bacterium]